MVFTSVILMLVIDILLPQDIDLQIKCWKLAEIFNLQLNCLSELVGAVSVKTFGEDAPETHTLTLILNRDGQVTSGFSF